MAQPARLPDPQTTIAMDPQPPHPDEAPTPRGGEGSSGPPTAVAPTTEAAPTTVAPNEGSSASPIAVAAPTDAGPLAAPPTTEPNPARRWIENPMQTLLVTVLVFLFGFVLTQTNDRITRLEDKVDAGFVRIDERFAQQDQKLDERFAQQDTKFEERFAQLDERFAQQDTKFDEINLKLTALIAALNATAAVEAALDGKLLDPNTTPTDNPAN